jgi:hypothetical protein
MVCPNCHSDQVIAVQDQHFCINCGQMVPESSVKKAKVYDNVQSNGLPEGVKILPLAVDSAQDKPIPVLDLKSASPSETATEPLILETEAEPLITTRERLEAVQSSSDIKEVKAKRRKPGRPKSGRLDVPKAVASTAPAVLPQAPAISNATSRPVARRSMNDIAAPVAPSATTTAKSTEHESKHSVDQQAKPKHLKPERKHIHRVGVAPLHYGPVLAFSFRARVRPRLVALAAMAAASLAAATGYGIWVLQTKGVTQLADGLIHSGPKLIAEAVLLAVLYYVGRSLGQTAIMYGLAREADQRPVTLSRQFGIGVNTFGRRLLLDSGYGLAELVLIIAAGVLYVTGGQSWPTNSNLQIGLIFTAYLIILYLLAALALSRGLAGVNLTLTNHRARTAARVGWQLFSHRVELVGPRLGAVLMEAVLSVPLVALVVALVVTAAPDYHIFVAIGAALLAWLAGSLIGVGTAAWWSMLYRQLVLADRPTATVAMLSSRQPEDARRAPLALIVAVSTLALAGTLILPWITLG